MTGSACGQSSPCKKDDVGELRSSFAFHALLLLDTYDAYRQGDGNRIFRNAKLEFLMCAASQHTKYKLNLWRMLAYDLAILSPREAYEYKWNSCVNLQGGRGQNIACDNMVELFVHAIKKRLRSQGANMTYESAQMACDTIQVHEELKKKIMEQTKTRSKSHCRATVRKPTDIKLMAKQIEEAELLTHHCNRQSSHFKNFVNPLQKLNVPQLCSWIQTNKERAEVEMVRHSP